MSSATTTVTSGAASTAERILRISGTTHLYAIIGDPIAQVKSPEVFSALFVDAGIDAVMIPVHVRPETFDQVIPALMAIANLDGIIATVPYKGRIVRHATRLGPTAARIGVLNALKRETDGTWTGEMFDGIGFVRAVQRKGVALSGRKVALFGAGGAGSAIGCELAACGVATLALIDPERARASALAAVLQKEFPGCLITAAADVPAGCDMIVNASTVGMRDGDGLPGAIGALASDVIVGDVIVAAAPTPILRLAQQHGCTTVNGREMIAGQADAVLAFFVNR